MFGVLFENLMVIQELDIIIIIIINPLTVRVIWAPQMILQPVFSIFPCSPLPSGTCNSRPAHFLMLSSHLFLCPPCPLSPFTVPCKMVLARPGERETWPYHCTLRLFTIARRSLCGPIACCILARTSSLVTWSLYEMCCILRHQTRANQKESSAHASYSY